MLHAVEIYSEGKTLEDQGGEQGFPFLRQKDLIVILLASISQPIRRRKAKMCDCIGYIMNVLLQHVWSM
jgi:hypothetical protein